MTPADQPQLTGVDPAVSLDEVTTEALRRLGAIVHGRISSEAYTDLVAGFLVGEVLAHSPAPEPANDVGAAADALLARLSGVLLVEMARRQGNRPHPGSRHVAD
jgi:hypothetical protein